MSVTIKTEDVLIDGLALATVIYEGTNSVQDVVLVHGFTGSKEDFDGIGPLLAESGFRVLTFDNRGQYQSAHSEDPSRYEMASLARDVIELTKHYEFHTPHLLGHSFGGLVAQQAILAAPELFASLTIFCSGPSGKLDWQQEPEWQYLSNNNRAEVWQTLQVPKKAGDPRIDFKRERWMASDAEATKIFRHHLLSQPTLVKELATLDKPIHVVYGEKDDAWPIPAQIQMAQDIGADVTVISGCGHCPNEDNPPLTAAILTKLWA